MTIASEIQRIKTNILNAYTACQLKGVSLPEAKTSANLSTTISSISSGGAVGIPREVTNGVFQYPSAVGSIIPEDANDIGNNALQYAFYSCSNLSGELNLSALTKISGTNALKYCFYGCSNITSVNLSNLVTISGSQALYYAFSNCTKLTSIDFSALETISAASALYYCFQSCTKLSSVTFSKLSSIASRALDSAFSSCTTLTSLYFPDLTVDSFSSTNPFYYMLRSCSNVTVHFPLAIENLISNWSDVLAGFNGTNTTILFDLKRATLSFTTTPTSDIYINGTKLTSSSSYVPAGDVEYLAYNSSSNKLLLGKETDVEVDSTREVSVNLNQTAQKITIATGVSGLSVSFKINGCSFSAVASSGNYSINFIGATGTTIDYDINGGDNYTDVSGTITTTGSAITKSVTVSSATTSTFSRPNLTSNGTLGGSSFAVATNPSSSSAYAAVNASTSDSAYLSATTSSDYIFYNPNPLKVTTIVTGYTSSSYSPTKIDVYGSNDGTNWTSISSHTVTRSTSISISPNSTRYYKYHKLTLTSTTIRISALTITATQKV